MLFGRNGLLATLFFFFCFPSAQGQIRLERDWIKALEVPNPIGKTFIPAPPLRTQSGAHEILVPAVRIRNVPIDKRFLANGKDLEGALGESILPPNDLSFPVNQTFLPGGVTEVEFNQVIDQLTSLYSGAAQKYGAQLVVQKYWSDPTVNAYASQAGNQWIVSMFGGIARHPRMTVDGLAFIMCHELGHHFGGFPFYPDNGGIEDSGLGWAAAEGQADYYAVQTCLRTFWNGDYANNMHAATHPNPHADHWTVYAKCLHVYQQYPSNDVAICVRSALSGKPLADIDSELRQTPYPLYHLPSDWPQSPPGHRNPSVTQTMISHPPSQCRLDTAFSAAVCTMAPTALLLRGFIPGKDVPSHHGGTNGLAAEREAAAFSCSHHHGDATDARRLPTYGNPPLAFGPWGYRPPCWFKENFTIRGPFLGF